MHEVERARQLTRLGRHAEAEAELRQVLARTRGEGGTHALLALVVLCQGRLDEAKTVIARALEIDPDEPYTYYIRSFVLSADLRLSDHAGLTSRVLAIDEGRAQQAYDAATEAVRGGPNNPDFLARLAELELMLGRWRPALELAEQALAKDPRHVTAAVLRSEALTRLWQPAEARATLHRVLASNPEAARAHAALGWALLRARDERGARQFFEEALRLKSDSAWAQEGFLECELRRFRLYRWAARYALWRGALSTTHRRLLVGGWLLLALIGLVVFSILASQRTWGMWALVVWVGLLITMIGWEVLGRHLIILVVQRSRAARSTVGERTVTRAADVVGSMAILILGLTGGLGLRTLEPVAGGVALGLVPAGWMAWLCRDYLGRHSLGVVKAYIAVLAVVGATIGAKITATPGWIQPGSLFLGAILGLLPGLWLASRRR